MAEAVCRRRKLHWYVRYSLKAVKPATFVQDLIDDARFGKTLNEVVQYHPLVMPGYKTAGFVEDRDGITEAASHYHIANLIVKFEHGEMSLSDDEILVIAMIANEREALRAARQVIAMVSGNPAKRHVDVLAYQEFRPRILAIICRRVARVELPAAVWTETIDRIEIQRWGAEILSCLWICLLFTD